LGLIGTGTESGEAPPSVARALAAICDRDLSGRGEENAAEQLNSKAEKQQGSR
jgi:hypothetical protein